MRIIVFSTNENVPLHVGKSMFCLHFLRTKLPLQATIDNGKTTKSESIVLYARKIGTKSALSWIIGTFD